MKNLVLSILTLGAILVATVSCSKESLYENSNFIKGDRVQVIPGDTITVTDTVYVEKIVEIFTGEDLVFDCYDFTPSGNIEGHTVNHTEIREFSYNFTMEAVKEIFFSTEQENAAFEVSEEAAFDSNSIATLKVSNGAEEQSVSVMVPGAHSVLINSKEVYPCKPFMLVAAWEARSNQTINGKEYQVAVVTYTFLNGYNEEVKSSKITLYSPIKVEEPEKPVNERTVNISYEEVDGKIIIIGEVDNTIDADEEFSVSIPRIFSIEAEDRKVVNGQNLNLTVGANPSEVSKEIVNDLVIVDGALTVTYNEYEGTYSHNVTASGNNVELKQTVKYYNGFIAELYGEKLEIDLPVSVSAEKMEGAETAHNNGTISCLYSVNYTASQSSLSSSAKQEVEIVMSAISFQNETVLYANRTVTFDALQSPKVYDCIVTSVSTGGNNFKYREVYADGSKSAWTSEALSDANFKFIEDGMKKYNNAALAIYNHKSVDGSRVGYLVDFLSTAGQIIYMAYNCPQSTFDAVNATMFGQLESCILGSAVKETTSSLMKMTCVAGHYKDAMISPAEILYFY